MYQGDGLNLYAYCGNNPVMYCEPSGYAGNCPQEQIGGDNPSPEKNTIPDNPSVVGHIFQNEDGHIPDTPENRALLENTSNNANNYRGDDSYGNSWYSSNQYEGK